MEQGGMVSNKDCLTYAVSTTSPVGDPIPDLEVACITSTFGMTS
ncbi:subtilosin A family bacteriocin [Staphylococcus chromogenes]|nr:subtilosin A family bacteriocin [Staphylococcus chromogenes]